MSQPLIAQHQWATSLMFLWLNGSKSLQPVSKTKLSQECEGCYSSTLIPVIFGMKCPIIACVQSPCVQIHLASSNIMCVWLRRNLSWSVLPSPDKQSSVCAFVCETKHGNTIWGKKKSIVTEKEGKRQ